MKHLVRIDEMGTYVNVQLVESLRSIVPRDGNPLAPPEYELRMTTGEFYYVEYDYQHLINKHLAD